MVIGAMAPDVPLFAPISDRPTTHRCKAVLTVNLAFGIALLAAYHLLLKLPLLALCPRPLRARLTAPANAFKLRRLDDLGWTLSSLALGSLTHVIWDAFTHEDGQVVIRFPALSKPLAGIPLFRYAQLGSGIFGLAVVTLWSALWLRDAPLTGLHPGTSDRVRISLGALTTAAALAAAAHGAFIREPKTFYTRIPHAIAGAMSATVACLTLYALAWWATDLKKTT